MGIKGLFPFLSENAPLSIKETKMEAMTGRVLAIDASTFLYQFLVAIRTGAVHLPAPKLLCVTTGAELLDPSARHRVFVRPSGTEGLASIASLQVK